MEKKRKLGQPNNEVLIVQLFSYLFIEPSAAKLLKVYCRFVY